MAIKSNIPTFDAGGNASITATTSGVTGPDLGVSMTWITVAGDVSMTFGSGTGGQVLTADSYYGPFPLHNLNLYKFTTASGTVVVNFAYAK